MYEHARCSLSLSLSPCVFLWFDVRIFSTFYIRTKLDFLLFINCRLCSIHRFSPNALLSTLFAAIIFLSLSLSLLYFRSDSAHLHRHAHTASSHAAEQITFTYLSRSRFIFFFSFVAAAVVVCVVAVVVVIIAFWPSH